jgi:chromosome segregation and condensation protein ScpB/DNA-binding XRE family transcriptional regulator
MSATDAGDTLAETLRQRRMALGWTLEQVAAQAQVSVGMLSLIETGKRRPSLRSWQRIRQTLGNQRAAARGGLAPAAARDLGRADRDARCLAWRRHVKVRLGLRRLAKQLEATGMQVLDDGSHIQLAPDRRFHDAVAQLVQPERLPRLMREQAEVLAIVIMDGMATRRRIEEVRGAAQLSIGPEGPVSLPRDSSETLAMLLSRGLLCAERDDHANGRPLVYRPAPRLLQLLWAETL